MVASYSGIFKWFWKKVSHFDYDKYWKMREYVTSHEKGIKVYYYLYRIKTMDAFHNASLGTHIGFNSAQFVEPPYFPHGLNGIIVSNDAIIGKKCQLYHQVTIDVPDDATVVMEKPRIILHENKRFKRYESFTD